MVLYTAIAVMACMLWHDMAVAGQIQTSMSVSASIPDALSRQLQS